MAVPTDRPIRFLQVVTFYPAYLRDFYAAHPELQSAPYADQVNALLDDGFSGCHAVSRELTKAGWHADTIIANAAFAQRRWLKENDLTLPEPMDGALIAAMQIQLFRPDAVYFNEIATFDSRFIRKIPTKPPLVMGWRGFPIPAGTDLTSYDVIATSFERIRQEAPMFGARDVQHHSPACPLDTPLDEEGIYDRDVIFSGSVTSKHASRIELLKMIWLASRGLDGGEPFGFELFMPDMSVFPPEMQADNRGSLWGNAMLRALRRSRITLNLVLDGYDQPPNMRVIEATGVGAFLLTNYHPELSKFFIPGEEVETFNDGPDLISKIRFYLKDDATRRAIARAGELRCRKDHNLPDAVARFRAMVEAKLAALP